MKVLLIDDNPSKREEVERALYKKAKQLKIDLEVETINEDNIADYNAKEKSNKGTQAPEDILAEIFQNKGDIDLIVLDHDLSNLNSYLSEPVVSIASHAASIPVCRYARVNRTTTISKLSDAIESGTTFSIQIDIQNPERAAVEILEILDGFVRLKQKIMTLKSEELNKGPASILANLLDDKTQEDYLAQYSISANIMNEIIQLKSIDKIDPKDFKKVQTDRLSYILGYWLYNSILKFPGVILNEKATASFLNISIDDFDVHKELFESAKYNGFFSLCTNYWWKDKLNTILDEEDVWSGKELLEKQGKIVNSCKCYYDDTLDAGYYCVIAKEPVSAEKSKGGISWLPSGAVLCRVGEEPYEQFAPLLGLA